VVSALRRAITEVKQRWSVIGWDGWPKIYYLELLRVSESTLSCWNPAALVVSTHQPALELRCGFMAVLLLFSCVIFKEGLCPSNGDILQSSRHYLSSFGVVVGILANYARGRTGSIPEQCKHLCAWTCLFVSGLGVNPLSRIHNTSLTLD
jgi:hypothetical protein